MELEQIFALVTIIVTLIMGILSKKSKFISDHLIPIQNLFIGLIASIVYYCITKDFSTAITLSSVAAGGIYDVPNNLKKIMNGE